MIQPSLSLYTGKVAAQRSGSFDASLPAALGLNLKAPESISENLEQPSEKQLFLLRK